MNDLSTDPRSIIARCREFMSIPTLPNRNYGQEDRWDRLQADIASFLASSGEPETKPVAYLHTVVQGDGEPDHALSFEPDNFPLKDVGGFRSLGHQPLYARPSGEPEALQLPDDARELLVTCARDAGFSDAQWRSMFYESGPYDITYPSFPTKRFVALVLERLSTTKETKHGEG